MVVNKHASGLVNGPAGKPLDKMVRRPSHRPLDKMVRRPESRLFLA